MHADIERYINALKNNIALLEGYLDTSKPDQLKLMWEWRNKIKTIEGELSKTLCPHCKEDDIMDPPYPPMCVGCYTANA